MFEDLHKSVVAVEEKISVGIGIGFGIGAARQSSASAPKSCAIVIFAADVASGAGVVSLFPLFDLINS